MLFDYRSKEFAALRLFPAPNEKVSGEVSAVIIHRKDSDAEKVPNNLFDRARTIYIRRRRRYTRRATGII
ncbi:MAG: hypothetical protein ACREO5_03415 [Candidatus Binatia bacterium]